MRLRSGGQDTNNIGVGAIVSSDWLFNKEMVEEIPYGLKRGQYRLRPYIDLYFSREDANCRKNEIKRPAINRIRK